MFDTINRLLSELNLANGEEMSTGSLKTSLGEGSSEPITEISTEPADVGFSIDDAVVVAENGNATEVPVENTIENAVVDANEGNANANADEAPSNDATHLFQRVTIEREPEHPNDSIRQILRELKEMNSMNFDDEQVRVTMKEDNPRHLLVTLAPIDGLYLDGQYEISMELPENYPHERPHFHCNTPIFHPNINYEGKICFSLLDESSSSLRIADYAHGLLWLLYYPNLYSRLNMDCPREEKVFAKMVRTSIVGGVVSGRTYERSPRLPKIENEKPEEKEIVNLQNEKNGKKWEWRLVDEDWVQVFV